MPWTIRPETFDENLRLSPQKTLNSVQYVSPASWTFHTGHTSIQNIKKCLELFAPRPLEIFYCLSRRPWIRFKSFCLHLRRGLFIQGINRPRTLTNALNYSARDLWKFAIVLAEDLDFSSNDFVVLASWPYYTGHESTQNINRCVGLFAPRPLNFRLSQQKTLDSVHSVFFAIDPTHQNMRWSIRPGRFENLLSSQQKT